MYQFNDDNGFFNDIFSFCMVKMVLICLGVILGQALATPSDLSEEDSGNVETFEFEDFDWDTEFRGVLTKQRCSQLVKKLWGLFKKCMEKGTYRWKIIYALR